MYLHLCIGTVSTLQYIYMPPKKRPVPKHVTRMHTGKLPSREASVITSAEPTSGHASPGAVGAPTVSIDRDSAANTCRDAANDATCPSEPTTRVDISSVCANAVDQHHCPANAIDQNRCDSDVDALLSGLLGDRKSQTDSSLARSHSSINTSSIEARNAASIEHKLIRSSLAPTIRAAYRRGVNMLRRYITSVCPAVGPSITHAVILQDSLRACSQQNMLIRLSYQHYQLYLTAISYRISWPIR